MKIKLAPIAAAKRCIFKFTSLDDLRDVLKGYMRGFWGCVLEMMPAILSLALIAGALGLWRKEHRLARYIRPAASGVRWTVHLKQVVSGLLVMLWIFVGLSYGYHVLLFHCQLWHLQSDNVLTIQVGQRQLQDRSAIDAIVRDLRASDWYSVSHGGWGDELPLRLQMRSGETWQMQVGYHFAQGGAIVHRLNIDPNARGVVIQSWGYTFSADLPTTLTQLGAPLPMCDSAHGRPCHD